MKTHDKIIAILILLVQVLFLNNTFAQPKARYNDEKQTKITITNSTSKHYIIFNKDNRSDNFGEFDFKGKTYYTQANRRIKASTGLGKDFVIIPPGSDKEIDKADKLYCYVYDMGSSVIGAEVEVTIEKFAAEEKAKPNESKNTKEEPSNNSEKQTESKNIVSPDTIIKPDNKNNLSKPDKNEINKIENKIEKEPIESNNKKTGNNQKANQIKVKSNIQEYQDEYQTIFNKYKLIKEKGKIDNKAERETVKDLLKECREFENKIRQEKDGEKKKELKGITNNIGLIIREIIKILIDHIDFDEMEKSYNENVFVKQKADIDTLLTEISSIFQKLNNSAFAWTEKNSIVLQIEKIDLLAKISKDDIDKARDQFFNSWIKKENLELEEEGIDNLKDFVLRLSEKIIEEHEALESNIQSLKKTVDDLKPPYATIIVTLLALVLIIGALIFYIRAYFKKKALKKDNLTNNDGIVPLENEDEEPFSYTSGLGEIRENADGNYYVIDMNSLFKDTAIQSVYINKKCIQDIYRFFSGSLKKNGKINETGCFAIGRWEYASPDDKNSYNISLEEIVKPGSDATYGEFTLDFGAQIGISLGGKIIELRQNTGNEYVHTSWIHSHPGLGLFLSAQDLDVQSQLKDDEHPNRMLAIVIDNNTENLDMAFYSPKKNGDINNKDDMKKKLSLEDIYQWTKKAISNVPAQSKSDYFKYSSEDPESIITDILFSGEAIIDMDHAIENESEGLTGYFYGKTDPVLQSVNVEKFRSRNIESENEENDPLGCLLVESVFSYQEILNRYEPTIDRYDFFAVYLPEDDILRFIFKNRNNKFPEIENKIIPIRLLEMKKWTRRRR